MIQDSRDMLNSPGLLDHAKEQVIILVRYQIVNGSRQPFAPYRGAPRLNGQRNCKKGKIGRPIWLKQRSLETVFAELVVIGIYQISIRMGLQKFHNLEKRIGLDHVVMIEKSDPLPRANASP